MAEQKRFLATKSFFPLQITLIKPKLLLQHLSLGIKVFQYI